MDPMTTPGNTDQSDVETYDFVFIFFYKKLEEMDEDSENRPIDTLSVVISVCFHTGDKTHKNRLLCQPQVLCSVLTWRLWCEGGGPITVERTSHVC